VLKSRTEKVGYCIGHNNWLASGLMTLVHSGLLGWSHSGIWRLPPNVVHVGGVDS